MPHDRNGTELKIGNTVRMSDGLVGTILELNDCLCTVNWKGSSVEGKMLIPSSHLELVA